MNRHIAYPAAGIASVLALAVLCGGTGAWAQATGQDAPGTTIAPTDEHPALTALNAEITRMRADIITLRRFSEWQANLQRIARSDPEEALRQRLPMSECRASVLAPVCDDMTALFAPGTKDEAPEPDPGDGLAPNTGEGLE